MTAREWGAPLLAREFEDGTHSLVWTQGVTRRRWLIRTVTWAVLASAVWAGAMAALVTWWRLPESALDVPYGRFGPGLFDIQGIVPVAYSVFAVALGIAAGAVLRRVVSAIAATLAIFTAVRVAIVFLRPHYMTPITKLFSFTRALTLNRPAPGLSARTPLSDRTARTSAPSVTRVAIKFPPPAGRACQRPALDPTGFIR